METVLSDIVKRSKMAPGTEKKKTKIKTDKHVKSEQRETAEERQSADLHPVSDEEGQTDIYQLPSLTCFIIQRYEGDTCEGGQPHGQGVAYFKGGHMYKGTFSRGLMDGHGVLTLTGGLKYEGDFVSNVPMGRGSYSWPDGSSYQGDVYYGIRHGTGTYTCGQTGVSYTGQWHQGQRHGKGTVFYNQEKTSWYEGDWLKNSREGWGVRRYLSGNIYSGEWKNNQRHGEGTMSWITLSQQFVGTWHNGVQHGRGTHSWILRRVDGSQYFRTNQYTGDFVEGKRHGLGTFYYAGGAKYEQEWRNDKKYGKGRFTSEDGRVLVGECLDDQMLSGFKAPPPSGSPVLGPDMSLNIDCLLEKFPERKRCTERQQVEFVVLRQNSELRSIYSFYSRLGHTSSPDNTFLLSRLQLWRLLKDCHVHHHGVTLAQIDHLITEDASAAEVHSPFTPILLNRLLSCLVVVAFHIYHQDLQSQKNLLAACLSKLMTDNILPHAKNVKGLVFRRPDCAAVSVSYLQTSWEVFESLCREERTMSCRQLLWMFKDLHLLDDQLTTGRLLQIMAAESPEPTNLSSCLDLQMTFLEFFEVLLGSAEVKCRQVVSEGDEKSSRDSEARRDLHEVEATENTLQKTKRLSQSVATMNGISNPESAETSEPAGLSAEGQQDVQTTVREKPQSAESRGEGAGEQTRQLEVELWRQTVHQFLDFCFFPAVEHHQLVSRNMTEEKLRQDAQRRIALSKAQHRHRQRGHTEGSHTVHKQTTCVIEPFNKTE
ncbi:radial spoke head 10 homolog B [Plectropomus leopardus]|uniref:radial spoke head 10 homolog B n=1 Tax=Plectropomus leopardus TaxID=160734 RepID=UPI001C4AFEBA|nr:radial spoke head 10 homolog B [Plectropomus leopardus]